MKDLFESAIHKQTGILEKNNKRFDRIGNLKLLLFILFVTMSYFMFTRDQIIFKISTALLFIIQIPAWIVHVKLGEKIDESKGIIEINKRHLMRLEDHWIRFSDIGEEFIDPDHPYSSDLDIIGKKSLFQYMNTTHTWHGRQALARDLLQPAYTKEQIKQRQEAVLELANDNGFTDQLEYRFSKVGNDPSAEKLVMELKDDSIFMKNKFLRFALTYIPPVILAFTALIAIFRMDHLYPIAAIFYTFQGVLWLIGLRSTKRYFQSVYRIPIQLNAYYKVLELVAKTDFTASELQQIRSHLSTLDVSATKAIKELDRISERVRVRSNPILCFIVNVLLLWDYECAFLFQEWKSRYAPHCEKWFISLGELESLLSFATMKKVCKGTCFPVVSDNRGVEADELGHPLIANDVRVTNQLRINNQILIISGSNMSGKTTYIRTVGINIVLARAGGAVCAKHMTFSDLHVITSMRISDDLNEGVSTFYAELKRIKYILDAAKSDDKTLFLIDELFRGTNSVDRLTGAKTVLTTLNSNNAIGMVTTHDLELCDLDKMTPRIRNFSFSEHYEDKKILFDYKIQPGKSKTTNAKYLMELIGII